MVGRAAYGRDESEVCLRTSQRLIVHPRTDATSSPSRSQRSMSSGRFTLHASQFRFEDRRMPAALLELLALSR
jgi:hypothetical protein